MTRYVIKTVFGYVADQGQVALENINGTGGKICFDRYGLVPRFFQTEHEALMVLRALWNLWPSHVLFGRILDAESIKN